MKRKLLIDVDDASREDSSDSGVGVVIRDYKGECISCTQCHLPHVVDAAMVEAFAFKKGLQIAQ